MDNTRSESSSKSCPNYIRVNCMNSVPPLQTFLGQIPEKATLLKIYLSLLLPSRYKITFTVQFHKQLHVISVAGNLSEGNWVPRREKGSEVPLTSGCDSSIQKEKLIIRIPRSLQFQLSRRHHCFVLENNKSAWESLGIQACRNSKMQKCKKKKKNK